MTETIRNLRKGPCQGCPDRYPACSDHCQKPEFLKWKEEQVLIRKNKAAYFSPIWQHEELDSAKYRKRKRRK